MTRPTYRLSVMTLAAAVGVLCAAVSSAPAADEALRVASPDERPVRPYRGLTYTAAGIREVRAVARDTPRGRILAAEVFASVGPWLALSDEAMRALVPAPDATLASGVAGDPKTNQSWPPAGRGEDMCSLDRPGTVRSPHTGDVYGDAPAGAPFHDSGDGWVRPADGRRFYFRGIWNSWIIGQLHAAVDNLALAFMLTGDERTAERGLLILDELATLKARRGEDPGLIDGASYGGANKHALGYSGNNANRRMFDTALSVDLLAGSTAARRPSRGAPGLSILDNLRENYFGIYERSYKENRQTLYNHTTALFSNQIAQAVLFGRPADLAEGIEVIAVWLEQCLTRDGQYYENAGGYERVGVDYAATMMLPLENYRPQNYDNPPDYPDPAAYPFGLRFGNDPRWYSAAFLMKYRMMASGRMIAFGDMWEDRLAIPGQTREWDPRLWCSFARLLYRQTDNPAWKEEIARRYWSLPEAVRNEAVLATVAGLGMSQWLEPARPAVPLPETASLLQTDSDLIPGKMIAIMRSGQGNDHRALFLSGSVHYSHGHDDQMAFILYAKGMCLTGTYGYPSAGSPTHRGWAIKPASHWSLVVNEDLPAPRYPAKNAPPASLQAWVPRLNGGACQLVEMSNPFLWQDRIAPDMTEYRRLLWMVDVSDEDFYVVDFFRATGGRTHDYLWTGQWLDQPNPAAGFAVQGIAPEPVPRAWTLAGLNRRWREAAFNAPGRSWAELLENGKTGMIRAEGIPSDVPTDSRDWNPPPENGYGFIYDLRRQTTAANWSATWDLVDGRHTMRLTMVNNEDQDAMTARNPASEAERFHSMVIARRNGPAPLRSRFAALVEAAPSGRWPVREAERLAVPPEAGMGVRMALRNGSSDVLLAGATPASAVAAGDVRLTGARAFVRRDAAGAVAEMVLHEGTALSVGGVALAFDEPAWSATVVEVIPSDTDNQVVVDRPLPWTARLQGRPVVFAGVPGRPGPAYLQDESYRLEQAVPEGRGARLHVGSQRIVAARVLVEAIEADGGVTSTWPNEVRGGRFADTGLFTGRRVAVSGEPGRATGVAAYPSRRTFQPVEKGLFKPGDRLEFHMIQTGDRARLPHLASLRRTGADSWELWATGEVTVRLPARDGQALQTADGAALATAAGGQVACRVAIPRDSAAPTRLRLVTP